MAETETRIRQLIESLRREGRPSAELRDAIELLIKITRNVLPPKDGTPVDPKFRQVNPTNADFNRKIWKSQAARQILFLSGWERKGEGDGLRLVRAEGAQNGISSQDLMNILVENRNITPLEKEWVAETKTESVLTPDERFRLEQRRGVEESRAAYEKAQREKREMKRLAENLKKEQTADREYRNIRRPLTDAELRAHVPQWNPQVRGGRKPPTPEEDEDEGPDPGQGPAQV